MGADDYGLSKRKRSNAFTTDNHARGPDGKKVKPSATHLEGPGAEKLRTQAKHIHEHYSSLCEASPDQPDAPSFQALIDAARGTCGQRRLVARLLPRFLAAFPPQLDTAAATLIDLHEQPSPASEQGAHRQLEEATRHDALLGLGCVLLAARGAGQPGAAAVQRVLDYLLRLAADSPDPEASEEGEEGHEEGELQALHTPTSSSSARATALLVCQLLSLAFLYHAIPFLDFCRGALRGRDPVARSGAQRALQRQVRERPYGTGSPEELLAALPLGQGMAAEAAAAQLTARLQLGDEEVLRQADQLGAAAGLQPLPRHQQQEQRGSSHAAGPNSSSSSSSNRVPSWAARVACEQLEVVPWVMRRLEGSTSGDPPPLVAWCRTLQQQLPQQLQPPPPSSVAAAAGAGSRQPGAGGGGPHTPSSPRDQEEVDMDLDVSPPAKDRTPLKRAASSLAAADQRPAQMRRTASLGSNMVGVPPLPPARGVHGTHAAAADGPVLNGGTRWGASATPGGAAAAAAAGVNARGTPAAGVKGEPLRAPPTPVTPAPAAAGPGPPDDGWPGCAAPVCVARACLLLSGLPPGINTEGVKAACKAAEVWLTGPGRACATFQSAMDAGRAILRIEKQTTWDAEFAATLPACSRFVAEPPQTSFHYVWVEATTGVTADQLAPLLVERGLQGVKQVVNVKARKPGALAEIIGEQEAADAAAYLQQRLLGRVLQPPATPAAAPAAAAAGGLGGTPAGGWGASEAMQRTGSAKAAVGTPLAAAAAAAAGVGAGGVGSPADEQPPGRAPRGVPDLLERRSSGPLAPHRIGAHRGEERGRPGAAAAADGRGWPEHRQPDGMYREDMGGPDWEFERAADRRNSWPHGPPPGAAAAAAAGEGRERDRGGRGERGDWDSPHHPRGGDPPPRDMPPRDMLPRDPDYGKTSLWVGNVPSDIRVDALLAACGRFGRIMDHKAMIHTRCAFVTYATHDEALAAKAGLDCACLTPNAKPDRQGGLRVEWAERQPRSYMGPPGGGGGGGGDRGPPLGGRRDSLGGGDRGADRGADRGPPMGPARGDGRAPLPRGWEERSMRPWTGPARGERGGDREERDRDRDRDRERDRERDRHLPHTPAAAGNGLGTPGAARGSPAEPHLAAASPGGPSPAPAAAAAASPGAGPQQQQQQGQQELWSGRLRKSGTDMCTLRCWHMAAPAWPQDMRPGAPEPFQWPSALEVNARLQVSEAIAKYRQCGVDSRCLLRLAPGASPEAAAGFQRFVDYLVSKQRAGLVKLPVMPGGRQRTLYLLVPEEGALREMRLGPAALGLGPDQGQLQLVALVVGGP